MVFIFSFEPWTMNYTYFVIINYVCMFACVCSHTNPRDCNMRNYLFIQNCCLKQKKKQQKKTLHQIRRVKYDNYSYTALSKHFVPNSRYSCAALTLSQIIFTNFTKTSYSLSWVTNEQHFNAFYNVFLCVSVSSYSRFILKPLNLKITWTCQLIHYFK